MTYHFVAWTDTCVYVRWSDGKNRWYLATPEFCKELDEEYDRYVTNGRPDDGDPFRDREVWVDIFKEIG
jgi:hypothetical protein